jgi:hypothetical protein
MFNYTLILVDHPSIYIALSRVMWIENKNHGLHARTNNLIDFSFLKTNNLKEKTKCDTTKTRIGAVKEKLKPQI